jgi:hypothetical protein
MSTFYEYKPDGSITGYLAQHTPRHADPYASTYEAASYPGPYYLEAHSPYGHYGYYGYPANAYQNGHGPVIAYGSWACPPMIPPHAHCGQELQENESETEEMDSDEHKDHDDDDGYHSEDLVEAGYGSNDSTYESGSSPQLARPFLAQSPHMPHPARYYPDVESIRKLHDMRGLLDHIQPDRLNNALAGPTFDVVEDGTNKVLAYQVPKKMMILLCGRSAITKHLRTLEREEVSRGYGKALQQEMRIPRGAASHVGFKIILAW